MIKQGDILTSQVKLYKAVKEAKRCELLLWLTFPIHQEHHKYYINYEQAGSIKANKN